MRLVASDTGPLLHLAEAGLEYLLPLSGEVHVAPVVAAEIARLNAAWASTLPSWVKVTQLVPRSIVQAQHWLASDLLHRGEAEALALAQQLRADWFLTDDSAARVLGNSLGIEVHGSLGVVLGAAAAGHLNFNEAEAALIGLAGSSLWLSPHVLHKARALLMQGLPPINP